MFISHAAILSVYSVYCCFGSHFKTVNIIIKVYSFLNFELFNCDFVFLELRKNNKQLCVPKGFVFFVQVDHLMSYPYSVGDKILVKFI